ncbi:MAG: endolytic transglycosylase MltG [Acidobacteria bacterium]|nr:endolytic transglycosylase MltG [Acidobacteriota bacterium]
MKRLLLWTTAAAALVFAVGISTAWMWLSSELDKPYFGAQNSEVFVDIPRGANANRIAGLLTGAGILRHRLPFRLYLRYSNLGRNIQAGEYRFVKPATPKQIVRRLTEGDVFYYSVTIPEGLTARETIALLTKHNIGNPAELERAIGKTEWIADLDPGAKNLEGYLFPETYRFQRKTDSVEIVKTMVRQFRTQLAKILATQPMQPDWTVSKIVILASMIEKETRKPEEAPLVSSVLINRLNKKMPLACDATIIYAMKLAGTYEGRLGKADMVMDSPYNTYRHPSLPPGPICNPGAHAIRAALKPAETEYFYYVSRNDGTHQFSKDYRSHLNAVNIFQKPLARRR